MNKLLTFPKNNYFYARELIRAAMEQELEEDAADDYNSFLRKLQLAVSKNTYLYNLASKYDIAAIVAEEASKLYESR